MTRVKRGVMTKKRHKKLLKRAEGFWGQRKNIIQRARETVYRALAFATKGRKLKKRDMRALFVARISAAAKMHQTSYSRLIHGLKESGVELNRKMLSQIACFDPEAFTEIVRSAKLA